MKTVLSPDMVAHTFAHQSQSEARNSGNSLFFDNDSIFSYGRHFCIAKHTTNKKGERALLFTTRGYSNTTAKHISIVRNATSNLNKIYCADPAQSHTLNLEAFVSQIKSSLIGLDKAKKPERYINAATGIYNQLNEYCLFFGLKFPKEAIKILENANNGKYAEYLTKESKRIQKEKAEREKQALLQFKEQLNKWRNGEGSRLYNRLEGVDYLRYNGKRIETSQGVEIPKEIARRAFKWVFDKLNGGGCLGDCNYKILDFEVNEVTNEFIKIGCHKITIDEIKAIGKQLNF